MLLEKEQSCLMVIDVQEKLVPAMADPVSFVVNCKKLMEAAKILSVPVIVTEQYPQGIGHTVPELTSVIPPSGAVTKNTFSAAIEPDVADRIAKVDKKQFLVIGTEAHVCVMQTALSLKAQGYDVYVVADAVGSRTQKNIDLAMDRLRQNGIFVVSTEMVIFEWLVRAGTPDFKMMQPIIK